MSSVFIVVFITTIVLIISTVFLKRFYLFLNTITNSIIFIINTTMEHRLIISAVLKLAGSVWSILKRQLALPLHSVLLGLLLIFWVVPLTPSPVADFQAERECSLLEKMNSTGQPGEVASTSTVTTFSLTSPVGEYTLKGCNLPVVGTFSVLRLGDDLLLQQQASKSTLLASLPTTSLLVFRLAGTTGHYSSIIDLALCPPAAATVVAEESFWSVAWRWLLVGFKVSLFALVSFSTGAIAQGLGLGVWLMKQARAARRRLFKQEVSKTSDDGDNISTTATASTSICSTPPPSFPFSSSSSLGDDASSVGSTLGEIEVPAFHRQLTASESGESFVSCN